MNATSPLVQARGSRVTADRAPMHPVVVDERRDQVAGDLEHAVVRAPSPCSRSSRTSGQARTWPVRRTSPTQPSSRRKTGSRPASVVGQAGPGRDLEAGRRAGRGSSWRRRAGRAWSRRRSSGTGRRRSCEAASRPAMPRTVSSRSASSASSAPARLVPAVRRPGSPGRSARIGTSRSDPDDPTDDRAATPWRRRAACVVRDGQRRPVLERVDRVVDWARAHVPMVAPQAPAEVPPSVLVTGRTIVRGGRGDSGSVDRPSVAGLHSGGVAAPRGHDRQIPHPRSARPVDDGPSPIGGERAVITRKPVRPAS